MLVMMMALGVHVVVMVLVPVMPEFGLVEQEEEHDADQKSGEQLVRIEAAFESLGQKMHERSCQQCAGGKAQEMLRSDVCRGFIGTRDPKTGQRCGQPNAADARGQRRDKNCDQGHRIAGRNARTAPPCSLSKSPAKAGSDLILAMTCVVAYEGSVQP
jgi:hypothetical protein